MMKVLLEAAFYCALVMGEISSAFDSDQSRRRKYGALFDVNQNS
ncbi:hypothetical protein QA646_30165 (plasmid) [Rhizobium sp. CB3090]|nr:hypothetical protein [Rhizobium sp. CB3090]WFU13259.1 hypothetical protein QA646_30165 [Rhizobium sp. CB3090]